MPYFETYSLIINGTIAFCAVSSSIWAICISVRSNKIAKNALEITRNIQVQAEKQARLQKASAVTQFSDFYSNYNVPGESCNIRNFFNKTITNNSITSLPTLITNMENGRYALSDDNNETEIRAFNELNRAIDLWVYICDWVDNFGIDYDDIIYLVKDDLSYLEKKITDQSFWNAIEKIEDTNKKSSLLQLRKLYRKYLVYKKKFLVSL